MSDDIENDVVKVDDDLIRAFLMSLDDAREIEVDLSVNYETNQKVARLRERMQAVSDRRILIAHVVHFALALAQRPPW